MNPTVIATSIGAVCLTVVVVALLAGRHRDRRPGALADAVIRLAAGLTTMGLMGIAGAISYQHLLTLALHHGQRGWLGHAFPLSVDGVEIVASLRLLADRRTRIRSGWLPWTALAVGTGFSLFANVATAQPDLIARIIAGWPAVAFLIAVKLLSGLLDQPHTPPPTTAQALPAADGARTTPANPPDPQSPRSEPRNPTDNSTGHLAGEPGDTVVGRRSSQQLPVDLMRRIPIHHDGYRRWQAQWADLQTDNPDQQATAARHGVTVRHLAWVRAAGQAGWLDLPDPPAWRLATLGANPPTEEPEAPADRNPSNGTRPTEPPTTDPEPVTADQ